MLFKKWLIVAFFLSSSIACAGNISAVLYAGIDAKTKKHDIFAVDPLTKKQYNLTQGQVITGHGWSQPWAPVGQGAHVVFHQFMKTRTGLSSKIYTLDLSQPQWKVMTIPAYFGFASKFSWAPDGSQFAFIEKNAQSKNNVIIIRDQKIKMRKPLYVKRASDLRWSPDGRWIGVCTEKGLLLLPTKKGRVLKIIRTKSTSFVWSADSKRLAVIQSGKIVIMDLNSRVLQTFGCASRLFNWSSDDRYISYNLNQSVRLLFLGGTKTIACHCRNNGGIFSPNNRWLAFWCRSRLLVLNQNNSRIDVLAMIHPAGYMAPSWVRFPEKGASYSTGMFPLFFRLLRHL